MAKRHLARRGTNLKFGGTVDGNFVITGTLQVDDETTFNKSIYIESANPALHWYETDQASNEGMYRVAVSAGNMNWSTRTDANGTGVEFMTFERGTGTAITSIELQAATNVTGDLGVTGDLDVTGDYTGGNLMTLSGTADVTLHLEADTDNVTEAHNPTLHLSQDGGSVQGWIGLSGTTDRDSTNATFTGQDSNGIAIHGTSGTIGIGIAGAVDLKIANGYVDVVNGMLHVGSQEAIDGQDEWLRLNQNNDFTNGIYSPGAARIDGGLQCQDNVEVRWGSGEDVKFDYTGTDFVMAGTGVADWHIDGSSDAVLLFGKTSTSNDTAGVEINTSHQVVITRAAAAPLLINRMTDDGVLVTWEGNGTAEGNVSVSGTSINYNGAHLSFLSHEKGNARNARNPKLVRGTVMEYDTEKATWWVEAFEDWSPKHSIDKRNPNSWIRMKRKLRTPNQAHSNPSYKSVVEPKRNEQLMTSKISDTAGSKKVAGVWDDWDTTESSIAGTDYCVATTGDFVIRVTGPCEQGDLLESNGDGTARVQADDIIRSSTIAKATQSFMGIHPLVENPELVPCQLLNG